jgi:diguanylate cyclase (GGDEF)-like protein/PAS domain S-box-containing protein
MPVFDDDASWRVAKTLLAHPHALYGAMEDRGVFVPVPAQLVELVTSGTALDRIGRTALDVVLPQEQAAVLDAWDQTRDGGGSSTFVHLRDAPESGAWVLHMLDVRAHCGTYLSVAVPTQEVVHPDAPLVPEAPARPRLAHIQKDQGAVISDVDDALTVLLGWTASDMVGHRSTEFIHPDDQELAVASWIEMLGSPGLGRRVRLRHARKGGGWAWFELTNHNLLDEQGHVLCEMVDISDEMAAHEALRAREQLLQRLAEALPVGVVQTDADGTVVYANGRAANLFGAELTHVDDLLRPILDLDVAPARDAFGSVLAGGDGSTAEIALADGRTHLSLVVRRLDEDGTTTGAVACFTDVSDSLRLRHELQQRAEIDPLTGSLNRSAVLERLTRAVESDGPGVAVVFVDLDGFKAVNDEQGHETGDEVLIRVADVLRRRCRDEDRVGRYGGDEFLVTCTDVDSPEKARDLAERFAAALIEHDLPASVGVSWSRPGGQSVRQLVAAADTAMYAAKAARGSQVVLAS